MIKQEIILNENINRIDNKIKLILQLFNKMLQGDINEK